MKENRSPEEKIHHYCAYQERSQHEARQKLSELGVYGDVAEQLIVKLIEGNFLNEERFATTYANGKFKIKAWGRNKIKQGLKLKQVPDKLIKKALGSLDEEEYFQTLKSLIEKKERLIIESDPYKRKYKLTQFALGRGFEAELINEVMGS